MLGRQSSLILTALDLAALEGVLRARGDIKFLSSVPNEGRNALLPLATLPIPENQIGKISSTCYLAPAVDLPVVNIRTLSDVKIAVQIDTSNIIELWRPYHRGDVIRAGRIYYTPRYVEDGDFQDKDPVFVKWAEGVAKAIRRSLTYDKSSTNYVGADAARLIGAGELKVIA